MQFRHEVKHEISPLDLPVLRRRLCAVMKRDAHAEDGVYSIRSLYFDSPADKALADKINGVSKREKYRIRMYNGDTSFIRLERKVKINSLGFKESAVLTEDTCRAILRGDVGWMEKSGDGVIREFYGKMKRQLLAPKVIVEYRREPFVYPAGNVRVTIDTDIRTANRCTDLLDAKLITVPAKNAQSILEVKWDNFLPDVIRQAVALEGRQCGAYSKYSACRMYE